MTQTRPARPGIAATEMVIIAPMLLLLLGGLWEIGRIIQIRNVLDEAAREGARVAGAGSYFASNNHIDPATGSTMSLASPSKNGDYEVQKVVLTRLQAAGLMTTGATVTVANTKGGSYTYTAAGAGSGSGNDPSAAANQLDPITVTITFPYQNVTLSPMSMFLGSSTTLTTTASWASMRDVPLTVSTTIPQQPLKSTDPLP
jgi:Flp pilus assembly protein TadG